MAIVPIYRLASVNHSDGDNRRYRFSREPMPDPNPHPGRPDEDHKTRWICEGVAFYAWSDQMDDTGKREELQPVYEFHRCAGGKHQYYYSLDEEGLKGGGWRKRPYVAFWAHQEDVEDGAPPVYRFQREKSKRADFALSTDREIEGWKREDAPAFYASERVPVRVSVRENGKGKGRRHVAWTFDPSTVNLAYGSILEFVPARDSAFIFTGLKVENANGDFDEPTVEDHRIQVRARCGTRGKDYKYAVRVKIAGQEDEVVGDPEIVNQAPTKL